MTLSFFDWKDALLTSSGSVSDRVRNLGDHVLELFWQDGCEPTMTALLDYCQGGLCQRYNIRASSRAQSSLPADTTPR
jgi:hypothetical protein